MYQYRPKVSIHTKCQYSLNVPIQTKGTYTDQSCQYKLNVPIQDKGTNTDQSVNTN